MESGRITEALNHFQKALEVDPDHIQVHYNMANALRIQGKRSEAIVQYQKAIDLQPDLAQAINNLAMMYAAIGENDQAASLFERLTVLNPDGTNNYYNVACMYARENRVEESIKWLKMAIDKGYDKWDLIKTDNDLESLRSRPEFRALLPDN
jgi:tetratricopeptide (TPR) repeat protein